MFPFSPWSALPGGKVRTSYQFFRLQSFILQKGCNSVAHVLATKGASLGAGGVMLWHEDVPEFVSTAVASDLAAID
jgi:hypothetical protein